MKIPKIIKDKAEEQGFNAIEFIGVKNGFQAFAVGCVDEEENPLPTGLPTVFLLKGYKISVVSGLEALDLL